MKFIILVISIFIAVLTSAQRVDFEGTRNHRRTLKATKTPEQTTKSPKQGTTKAPKNEPKSPKATKRPKSSKKTKTPKTPKQTKVPKKSKAAPKSTKAPKAPKSVPFVINFNEEELDSGADRYLGNEQQGFRFRNTLAVKSAFAELVAPEFPWDEMTTSKPNSAATVSLNSEVVIECPGGKFDLKGMTLSLMMAGNSTYDLTARIDAYGKNGRYVDSINIDFKEIWDVKYVKFPKSFKSLQSVELYNAENREAAYGFDDIEVIIKSPCESFNGDSLLSNDDLNPESSTSWFY